MEKELEIGDICLLDVEEYAAHWPLVGEIMDIEQDNITIRWYKGSILTKYTPEVLIVKGKGRTDWSQTVPKSAIWLHGFKLTKKGYLPTHVRSLIHEHLKQQMVQSNVSDS